MANMRVGVLVLTIVSAVFTGCNTVLAADTFQAVLTTEKANVVFGAGNIYSIWARDMAIIYNFRFFFGLGFPGDQVRTDTTVTLGARNADASKIYACIDGLLQLVDVDPSGTPQNSIVRVRYNSTDGFYRLQITEATPPVFVQFTYLSLGGILCTPGVAGSPLSFISRSSASHARLDEPATTVLRQEVDI